MMFDLFSGRDNEAIDHLRAYCVALYLILDKNGLIKEGEFDKCFNQAVHFLEQAQAKNKEEAITNMTDEERRLYNFFNGVLGPKEGD